MRGLVAAVLIAQPAVADTLRCVPALPVFCANVHVGCAGKTDLPTARFTISPDKVIFADGEAWPISHVSDSGAVYRPPASQDWIRIAPDNRFSQRIYTNRGPVMTYGICE